LIVPQRRRRSPPAGRLLGSQPGQPVEAVKGYLNLYFSSAEFTQRWWTTCLKPGIASEAAHLGRAVMVEYSQPNSTSIHVGTAQRYPGEALARIWSSAD